MRPVLTLALSLASVLAVTMGGMQVASALMTDPAPHAFPDANVASLWTTAPTRVDPASQDFERLPAIRTAAPQTIDKPVIVATVTPVEALPAAPLAEALTAEHLAWCANRYRSYRAEDNSYRPYDGPRRACMSPFTAETLDTAVPDAASSDPAALPTATLVSASASDGITIAAAGEHEVWCATRYRSYRPADNSYQPYDGPRQTCVSPHIY